MDKLNNTGINEPLDSQTSEIIMLLSKINTKDHNLVMGRLKEIAQDLVFNTVSVVLQDANTENREKAVQVLMELNTKKVLDSVLPLMVNDPDAEVRWNICYYLFFDGDQRALQPLVKVLLRDKDANVRAQAAAALGSSRDSRVRAALIWTRDHDFEETIHGITPSSSAAEALRLIDSH